MKAIITAISLIFLVIQPALAEPANRAWLEWFKSANAHLRTAVDYLRTDNPDFAAMAVEELIASEPPAGLPAPLASAANSALSQANAALVQIDAGKGKAARHRLLELRQAFYDTNRENNIDVFDDCIWAVHKSGPPLWHYRRNKPDFSDAKQRQEVAAVTSIYLAQLMKCEEIVPDEIKADEQWNRVALGAITSLRRIKTESLANQDVDQFIRFVRELLSFNNLLYFRYG